MRPAGQDAAAAGVGLVRFVLVKTFVEPVREGRLRSTGWPAGLRGFVRVAVLVYGLTMVAAVLSGLVRRRSTLVFAPPSTSLPVLAVPLVGVATTLALACLFAAGLHARWAFRVPATVVVGAVLLAPVDWSRPGPFDLVTAGLVLLLPLLVLLRARRPFHWAEPVAAAAVVGLAVVSQQAVALAPVLDAAPGAAITTLTQQTDPLWALAAPVSVLAGATLAEVTASAVTWSTTGWWSRAAGRRRTRGWTAAALVLLVVVRAIQEVRRATNPTAPVTPGRVLLATGVVAVVAAGCATSTWLSDRTPAGDDRLRPDPDDLLPAWRRCAPWVAVALGATIGLQLVVGVVLGSVGLRRLAAAVQGGGDTVVVVTAAVLTSAGLLAGALVLSVRGRRRAGLVLTSVGLTYAVQTGFAALGLSTGDDDVLAVVTVVAVAVLVALTVRRSLSTEAEVAIAGVLLLTAVYGYRDWLDDPLTSLVSLGGVSAALLVGLVWRLLTDNGFTRAGSPGFPQPTRVLLALANALVGVTSAALVALSGGRAALDFSQTESLGDGILGFPLVLALAFAGLTLAARGRRVRSTRRPRTTPAATGARTA